MLAGVQSSCLWLQWYAVSDCVSENWLVNWLRIALIVNLSDPRFNICDSACVYSLWYIHVNINVLEVHVCVLPKLIETKINSIQIAKFCFVVKIQYSNSTRGEEHWSHALHFTPRKGHSGRVVLHFSENLLIYSLAWRCLGSSDECSLCFGWYTAGAVGLARRRRKLQVFESS
jgi:hypothetical protein